MVLRNLISKRFFAPPCSAAAAASARAGPHALPAIWASRAFTSIPIIDVEPLVFSRAASQDFDEPGVVNVVKEMDDACKNVGFFYVKGHGVPQPLIDEVREVGREFFRLPAAEKLHIRMTSAGGYRGYQTMAENVTKGIPDLHEAVDYFQDWDGVFPAYMSGHPLLGKNQWPDMPQRFRPLLRQYLQVMQDLGKTIMQGIGLALNGSPQTFEGKRAGDPFWVLRVIGYPPIPNQTFDDVGCGEHTDYGLLTLVNQDTNVRALQVKNQAGQWIWADPIPGTFLVNIGNMLEIWSNGMYVSTVHRVLNDDTAYRVSVPFFYEPNMDAVVEPLEKCKEMTGGSAKYGAVVYGDHLVRKVLTNFG